MAKIKVLIKRICAIFSLLSSIYQIIYYYNFLDYGIWTDGVTTYANASTCDLRYIPKNPPILFDIELPNGVTKESFEIEN